MKGLQRILSSPSLLVVLVIAAVVAVSAYWAQEDREAEWVRQQQASVARKEREHLESCKLHPRVAHDAGSCPTNY